MGSTPKILVQLDSDPQPSVFDSIVALDSGVDHLLRHHDIVPANVREHVYGTIFTRAADTLCNTAIFVGGSDVTVGEKILSAIRATFFGPMRVSVMLDAGGANTTAASAVLAAGQHVDLSKTTALVLAATGPVGMRAVRLLAGQGAVVRVGSRSVDRAEAVCRAVAEQVEGVRLSPHQTSTAAKTAEALDGVGVVIAAGAVGVELLSDEVRRASSSLQVVIDLNAVPPAGIGGVEAMDRGTERDGMTCFGALGVGATKMKIHRAAIRKLFETNDQILDAEEIFQLGRQLQ